ncbi:hypothetical protein [Peribacillus sp. TH27]|uniref:hypothetical protein n=1 Tax=Peribacillus sp. TH27 TaxID=2798484 RepID=UPI001914D8A4|nr:hypothetical protein [Peribacillus sp. TH27]MBK5463522.1 hypothetical protein [Peribacillus sp. TH27]
MWTSPTTFVRRFDDIAEPKELFKVIVINTKVELIIADGETKEPIYILQENYKTLLT